MPTKTQKITAALTIYQRALEGAVYGDILDCTLCKDNHEADILDKIKAGDKLTCVRCNVIISHEMTYLKGLLEPYKEMQNEQQQNSG